MTAADLGVVCCVLSIEPAVGVGSGQMGTIEPDQDRSKRDIRRGRPGRAALLAAVGAAVVLLITSFMASLAAPSSSDDGLRGLGSLASDGWSLAVPGTWRSTAITGCENRPDSPVHDGIIVSSVGFAYTDPQGGSPSCEDRFIWAGYPSAGVALSIEPVGFRTGIFTGTMPPTPLPLTPLALSRTDSIRGGPSMRYVDIVLPDANLVAVVRTFTGPDASATDRAALDQALASIRFAGSAPSAGASSRGPSPS